MRLNKGRLSRSGFTLIELLVVIAIIAILAAILFPVFSKARAAARKTSCLSNIKQLTLGMTMYAQDYDETFPQWNWGQSSQYFTNDGTTIWWNAIYPYVKNAQVYVCPDNKYTTKTKDDGAWGYFKANADPVKFAQSTNTNVALATVCLGYAANEPISVLYPNLAGLPRPAETLLIADGWTTLSGFADHFSDNGNNQYDYVRINRIAYPNGWDQSWFNNGVASGATDGPFDPAWDQFARHTGGNNIGYVDGHARYLAVSQTTIKLFGLPQ